MNKEEKFTAPEKDNQKYLLVAEELEEVSSYAAKKIAEIGELYDSFRNMSYLRLIRDSKVAEKDKKIYNRFSLSASHRENILQEIQKYQKFYKELIDAVLKASNEEKCSDHENAYVIFCDFRNEVSKMVEVAKHGKDTTTSLAVFDLHKSFIEKHEMLENMIMRIECLILKEGLKKATYGWKESVKSVEYLQTSLKATEKGYDEMCTRFEKLLRQNEELLDQQKFLLENIEKMQQQQNNLLQEHNARKPC